jgi:hypothetical protein
MDIYQRAIIIVDLLERYKYSFRFLAILASEIKFALSKSNAQKKLFFRIIHNEEKAD